MRWHLTKYRARVGLLGQVNTECHSAQRVSPFLVWTKERFHAFPGSCGSPRWLSHVTCNETKSELLSYSLISITLKFTNTFSSTFPPPTAILSNSNNHRKCHHPLVTDSWDHHSFANESVKTTLLQRKVRQLSKGRMQHRMSLSAGIQTLARMEEGRRLQLACYLGNHGRSITRAEINFVL